MINRSQRQCYFTPYLPYPQCKTKHLHDLGAYSSSAILFMLKNLYHKTCLLNTQCHAHLFNMHKYIIIYMYTMPCTHQLKLVLWYILTPVIVHALQLLEANKSTENPKSKMILPPSNFITGAQLALMNITFYT